MLLKQFLFSNDKHSAWHIVANKYLRKAEDATQCSEEIALGYVGGGGIDSR